MATAPSCNDFDLHSSRLHWVPNKKFQIGDFFGNVPPLPKEKKVKAKVGGLVVPTSSDEESSSSEDEDEDEDEDPKAGKFGNGKLYDDEGEGEEEEDEEDKDEDEDDDLPDALDGDDEAEKNDYDDDPMDGSSGPSLSSGSEFRPSR